MSLITVAGMLGGLAVFLLARRGRKAAERLLADQRAGLIGPDEVARAKVQQKERSLRLGKGVCAFLGLLLLAVLGRAAVTGEWGGTTLYYAVLVVVLLLVSAFTLSRVAAEANEAKNELGRPGH
ncbi:hypothetical protein NE857_28525 [Nocardiopsis exhalans]|uniref:Na+/melibiose symporter-like transporter n=2 Tax=Nocardiopsis TaxID=2013 RepID=A0A840W9E1_9ACTN|nr:MULTISPECIES: hypothetical protein [Nocardiopsis]MBB5492734.1 Na+/melibiose symporter-like transporter [Nocardiopsis metallicus]QRN80684.1 MAG: hypothetical protein JK586_03710 [Nocardiopsis sp. BM-2018]USY19168.1 hypothetical protein NE857_28525 [Nocardiopsis exhalans]